MINFIKSNKIILFACCLFLALLFLIPVFAADEDSLVVKVLKILYLPGEVIASDDVYPLLAFDVDNFDREDTRESGMAAVWDAASAVYTSLSTVGAAMALLYFLIELLDKTTREMMTLESFIIFFIKLILVMFLLNNGLALIKGLIGFNNDICETIANSYGTKDSLGKISSDVMANNREIYDKKLKDIEVPVTGWVLGILIVFEGFPVYLCYLIASLYITFMCWARFFEIGIRTAFAPIGLLDIVSDGFKISNLKYFKKLFAVIFEGAIIVLILTLVSFAQSALVTSKSIATGGFALPLILFTEIGLIKKAQQLANDVLGV